MGTQLPQGPCSCNPPISGSGPVLLPTDCTEEDANGSPGTLVPQGTFASSANGP